MQCGENGPVVQFGREPGPVLVSVPLPQLLLPPSCGPGVARRTVGAVDGSPPPSASGVAL